MSNCSLSHLSDGSLSRDLAARIGRERTATAEVLPYLAEFDARRLAQRFPQPDLPTQVRAIAPRGAIVPTGSRASCDTRGPTGSGAS